MKHKRLLIGSLFLSGMAISVLTPAMLKESLRQRVGKDNAVYGDRLEVDYNTPDVVFPKQAAASVAAASVSIHYHNDDGRCADREMWIWCSGAAGAAHQANVVSSDGKDMEVSFNFTGEWEGFYGKKGIFFIVKWKKGVPEGGGDGWQQQSLNIEVPYKDEFEPDANGHVEIWSIPGEGSDIEVYPNQEGTTTDRFTSAVFSDWSHIKVTTTSPIGSYKLYALTSNYMNNSISADLEDYLIAQGNAQSSTTFYINLGYKAKVNVQYMLTGVFPKFPQYTKKKYVGLDTLYETERFTYYYNYDGKDLGCTYNGPDSTTFKVWAPASANVRVYLYNSGSDSTYISKDPTATDSPAGGYNMAFRPGGVWELTIRNRDLKGMYYKFFVANALGQQEAMDPYAKACGVNGNRAMIVDWNETNPDNWASVPAVWDGQPGYDIDYPNELSIYETHIRDLTMDETWTGHSMRGTYSAFAEKGTKYSKGGVEVTTGYDHIEEFGMKAIQLIPVFDNDNSESLPYVDEKGKTVIEREYNWGYNPLNYNCVDGSYATDPYNGISRIKEFKSLIKAYSENENHTRIIMDVVYNHVSSIAQSFFTKLMPKYYFRYAENGSPHNGSGCGNEVKSEAPMMSKYIVESLVWWAKEYKIKGFRFDLMGLIDWKTIKEAAKQLYKIDKDIYLYGEGWSMGCNIDTSKYDTSGSDTGTIYSKLYKEGEMTYVGGFNDGARNALAGETGNADDWGFIDQGADHVRKKSQVVANMLVGMHSGFDEEHDNVYDVGYNPNQMIAYSSCHDDFSTYDHLLKTMNSLGSETYEIQAAAATAAVESAVLMSNGVAFIQGGQECFLTKRVSAEDIAKYGDERTIDIGGYKISSNSYRLSDYTNSIKWDRKIQIGETKVNQYYEGIKKASLLRNKLPKYSKEYLDAHEPWSGDTGPNFNVRGQGDKKVTIALYNNKYTFILAGNTGDDCNNGFVEYRPINTATLMFTSNPTNTGNGYDKVTNGVKMWWYTGVCFKQA